MCTEEVYITTGSEYSPSDTYDILKEQYEQFENVLYFIEN